MDRPKTRIVVRVFWPKELKAWVSFDHENTELDDVTPIIKWDHIWYIVKYKTDPVEQD